MRTAAVPVDAGREPAHDPRPRVLIVDDSAVARAMMTQMVSAGGRFVVAGALPGAAAALAFLAVTRVDVILLDIAMPGTDGLTALPDLIAAGNGARVVIVSSSAGQGAAVTIQALAMGAADTLVKPAEPGGSSQRFRASLLAKLDRLVGAAREEEATVAPLTPAATEDLRHYDLVAIGASTGGIHALGHVLRALGPDFRLPILITQHLPSSFMPYFAAQLALLAGRPCEVAADRTRVRPGRILVAPGDAHLRCVALADGSTAVRLIADPQPSGCLPSVDPMFASVAQVYGSRVLAVVLSGMGRDGAEGARAVREAGGCVLVQDRDSSVVWGMPGAVAQAGLADAVLPPSVIGALIAKSRRP